MKRAEIADFIGLSREQLFRNIKKRSLTDTQINLILQCTQTPHDAFYAVQENNTLDNKKDIIRRLEHLEKTQESIETDLALIKKLLKGL